MHLEIKHLQLVAGIADAGGVTRASDRLFLTQSALSHQLKTIEERLGTPLFLRVGHSMVLTSAGEKVLQVARRVIVELERAEAEINAEHNQGPAGLLRLATLCYTCYHWLPPVLTSFRAKWPRVDVRIVLEATRRPVPALVAGDLDLAVISHRVDDQPLTARRRLEYEPLFRDELVVVVPPSHPLAKRDFARPSDFEGEHIIRYNVPEEDSSLLTDILRPAGVRPASVSCVDLTEAIIELVKAGLGITVLASWAVAPHVKAGTIVTLPLTANGYYRQWTAAYRSNAEPDGYLREFVTALASNAFPTNLAKPKIEAPKLAAQVPARESRSSKRARSA